MKKILLLFICMCLGFWAFKYFIPKDGFKEKSKYQEKIIHNVDTPTKQKPTHKVLENKGTSSKKDKNDHFHESLAIDPNRQQREKMFSKYKKESFKPTLLVGDRLYPKVQQKVSWDRSCDDLGVSHSFSDLWNHATDVLGTTRHELPVTFPENWYIHSADFNYVQKVSGKHYQMTLAKFPKEKSNIIWQVHLFVWRDGNLDRLVSEKVLAPANKDQFLSFTDAYNEFRALAIGIIDNPSYQVAMRGLVYADRVNDVSQPSDYVIELAGSRVARLESLDMLCEAYSTAHATCYCR